jgi:hypothetical protein
MGTNFFFQQFEYFFVQRCGNKNMTKRSYRWGHFIPAFGGDFYIADGYCTQAQLLFKRLKHNCRNLAADKRQYLNQNQ